MDGMQFPRLMCQITNGQTPLTGFCFETRVVPFRILRHCLLGWVFFSVTELLIALPLRVNEIRVSSAIGI